MRRNRKERIQEAIARRYPGGVPPELTTGREIKVTAGASAPVSSGQ